MMEGWVKLHRCITESAVWIRPASELQAWLDIILTAGHREHKVKLRNDVVVVPRGGFLTSSIKLAERWGWGRTKVRYFLDFLKNQEMITTFTTSSYTLIEVVNYDKYQDDATNSTTSPQPAHNQPTTINKNVKNVKKEEYTPEFEAFWKVYPRKLEKRKAAKCWQTRLKEGHDQKELINAAINYARAMKGKDPEFIKYPPTFLGPSKPFEDYLNYRPPRRECLNASMPPPGRSPKALLRCGCEECQAELEKRKEDTA